MGFLMYVPDVPLGYIGHQHASALQCTQHAAYYKKGLHASNYEKRTIYSYEAAVQQYSVRCFAPKTSDTIYSSSSLFSIQPAHNLTITQPTACN